LIHGGDVRPHHFPDGQTGCIVGRTVDPQA
jgi:hypothetical protein